MTNINLTSLNNKPINQGNTITLVKKQEEEWISTSLKVKPTLYREFTSVAKLNGIKISEFLEYAMKLAIKEKRRK